MAYGNGTNQPYGLRPSQYLNGSTWSGQLSPYNIKSAYATNIFQGDPVYLSGGNDGCIGIATAGDANPILGVFWGCEYTNSLGEKIYTKYWPASTVTQGSAPVTAYIIDDPNVIFDTQSSNSTTLGVRQTYYLRNIQLYAGAGGNTANGQSSWGIDITTIGGGATSQAKILRITPVPGNVLSTGSSTPTASVYNSALILINNHMFKGSTGTVGGA